MNINIIVKLQKNVRLNWWHCLCIFKNRMCGAHVNQVLILTRLWCFDTLAVFLLVAFRADAHVASFVVDTLLVLLTAHGLRLRTLVDIWKTQCDIDTTT